MSDDIRIVFTASNSWFGRAIRKLDGSRTSHVFVEGPVWGTRTATEATVGGTRLVKASRARHNVIAEIRVDVETKPAMIKLADFLGSEYDYGGLFCMALMRIAWTWFRIKIKRPFWKTNALKCSELVHNWLHQLDGGVGYKARYGETVTPENLLKHCLRPHTRFEVLASPSGEI